MALKAFFPSGKESITVTGLYQWDYGQQLEIEEVSLSGKVIEVHFSCTNMTEAIVRHCFFDDNGIGTVSIPDDCLEQATPITAWIYDFAVTQGKTVKVITLPVIARTRPSAVREISADDEDDLAKLITDFNKAVEDLKSGNIVVQSAKNAETANTVTGFTGKVEQATFADAATKATRDYNNDVIHSTYLKKADKPKAMWKYDANVAFSNHKMKFDAGVNSRLLIMELRDKKLDDIAAIGFSFVYTHTDGKQIKLEAQGIKTTAAERGAKYPTDETATYAYVTCNVSMSGVDYLESGSGSDTHAVFGSITVELTQRASGYLYLRFVSFNVQVGRLYQTAAGTGWEDMKYITGFDEKSTLKDVFVYAL